MRRENRGKKTQNKSLTDKIIIYAGIGLAIFAVIVFALFMYSKSLSDEIKDSTRSLEEIANMTNNTQNTESNENSESASTEIGKTVEEAQNALNSINTGNTSNNTTSSNKLDTLGVMNTTNSNSSTKKTSSTNTNTANKTKNTNNSSNQANQNNQSNQTNQNATETETKKELKFQKPVEGDIVREYARDNLIYSETLQEWTTHLGVDIKAEKTTVVNAAEEGTIKSIKNDPRYGLTIVIEHENNYQTIYSNLLTSEFVVEGEKVEKGQAIGTVGNTAVFEIADEAHLHFEILKDSLPIDPNTVF